MDGWVTTLSEVDQGAHIRRSEALHQEVKEHEGLKEVINLTANG